MKEQCAVAEAMCAVAAAGGESRMGTGQARPKKFTCAEDGCPVVAHVEKGSAGEFLIRTENAEGQRILGFCKNGWVSQSVTVD